MVTTRSNVKVRKPGVRFKRGSSVRRILEFDDSDSYSDNELPSSDVNHNKAVPKGILKSGLSNGSLRSMKETVSEGGDTSQYSCYEKESNSTCETSVLYDVDNKERCRVGTPCMDTLLFLVLTLSCYFIASYIYVHWGYRLYMLTCVLCIITFSYNIAYYDSMKPGVVPPSPISPMAYRQSSGHTFHLSYAMTILNGVIFFLVEPYLLDIVVPPV